MITLYSTGCPKCKILKQKLDQYNIQFVENNDIDEMTSLGIEEVPVIKLEGGTLLNFITSNSLLNEKGEEAFKEVKF